MFETMIVLGGGGWLPAHGRHTACALLRERDRALVLDAGTGVARLLERPDLLEGVQQLDIVLTHFHLDHLAGLAYLPAIGVCPQTTVWGPGRLLYGTSTEGLLDRVLHEPFHPVSLQEQDVAVRDLPPEEIELSGARIALRTQGRHSAPTLAFRIGDTLAWFTDTAYEPDSATFASGCELVAHEAWFESASPRNPEIHSSASDAARVAQGADARRLLLIHLPPFQASLDGLLDEAHQEFEQAELGHDYTQISMAPA